LVEYKSIRKLKRVSSTLNYLKVFVIAPGAVIAECAYVVATNVGWPLEIAWVLWLDLLNTTN